MPTTNIPPTSNTTPNIGGTSAVTSATNTGHGQTESQATAADAPGGGSDTDAVTKTCLWSAFDPSLVGVVTSLKLQFTWAATGTALASPGDGTAEATAEVTIEYSVDGGSNWTTAVNHAATDNAGVEDSFDLSASEDITISLPQTISLVRVRDSIEASATATAGAGPAGATATATATISGIQLQAVTQAGAQVVVIM